MRRRQVPKFPPEVAEPPTGALGREKLPNRGDARREGAPPTFLSSRESRTLNVPAPLVSSLDALSRGQFTPIYTLRAHTHTLHLHCCDFLRFGPSQNVRVFSAAARKPSVVCTTVLCWLRVLRDRRGNGGRAFPSSNRLEDLPVPSRVTEDERETADDDGSRLLIRF